MATPTKTAAGTWRMQIEVGGVRDSNTLPTKREIQEWAARRSIELKAAASGRTGELKSLQDVLQRYALEVSPDKKGWQKEAIRLKAYQGKGHVLPLKKPITEVTEADLIAWRDERLKKISRGAVLRDMTLLGSVLEHARREWKYISSNPMRDVSRPQEPDHRERLITWRETKRVLRKLGHKPTRQAGNVRSVSQAVALCYLVALSTGMRAGELAGLTWDRVYPDYVRLRVADTKTSTARDVPLSRRARAYIARMRGWDDELVFGVGVSSLDTLFRRARVRAGLDGFTFHDSRHTAATMIAGRMRSQHLPAQQAVLDLCKIFGWKRIDQALVYFNPAASDIASRLG
ncbi:tyrosine-type recombinase/integrase [Acidovorax sp.]|uniref:tyrosine-type recombinase/integrase n=1 Tax=Acidovorax sp. TaxID=1872122 RepID=UPI003D065072